MASRFWTLLLQNDLSTLRDLCSNPDASGIKSVALVDENNLFEWSITIIGPRDTPYEGGIFKATINFHSDFPSRPRTVKFTTEIWHPNVSADGRVYGYVIGGVPARTVESIRLMLSEPNIEFPANIEAAEEWRDRIDDFNKKVERCVWKSKMGKSNTVTNAYKSEIGERTPSWR